MWSFGLRCGWTPGNHTITPLACLPTRRQAVVEGAATLLSARFRLRDPGGSACATLAAAIFPSTNGANPTVIVQPAWPTVPHRWSDWGTHEGTQVLAVGSRRVTEP
ncbi:MAG: hypothetical protein WDW38_008594 [Sanguina aurantia]